jgi:hypothetical protein
MVVSFATVPFDDRMFASGGGREAAVRPSAALPSDFRCAQDGGVVGPLDDVVVRVDLEKRGRPSDATRVEELEEPVRRDEGAAVPYTLFRGSRCT